MGESLAPARGARRICDEVATVCGKLARAVAVDAGEGAGGNPVIEGRSTGRAHDSRVRKRATEQRLEALVAIDDAMAGVADRFREEGCEHHLVADTLFADDEQRAACERLAAPPGPAEGLPQGDSLVAVIACEARLVVLPAPFEIAVAK